MMNHIYKIRFHIAVLFLVMVVPSGASAAISAFKFLGIDASGSSCDLSDRLGTVSGSTDHVINIQDCIDNSDCNSVEIKWGLDRTPASGATYAVKVSRPGGSCDTSSFSETDNTTCLGVLVGEKSISSPNYMTFTLPFQDLAGDDCQAGWNKETRVYILVDEDGSTITSETIVFVVDLERPEAPELDEPEEGDSNITVKWQAVEDSSDASIEYNVYWDDSSFTNATRSNASVHGPMSGTSYQITDLDNDVEYFYAVSSIDENDNESLISAVSSAMPVNVSDFWESYQAAGGTEDGGFCFLATAAWGSYLAPEVRTLRQFRDTFLMTNAPGRAFVRFYYSVSPRLASAISTSPVLRAVTRAALAPLVVVARAMTAMSPAAGLVAGLSLVVLLTILFGVAVRSWRRS